MADARRCLLLLLMLLLMLGLCQSASRGAVKVAGAPAAQVPWLLRSNTLKTHRSRAVVARVQM
jgi:hypothetical protein